MTRDDFTSLLKKATAAAVEFARRYVENDLPSSVRYRVLLNQSHDANATSAERVYPEDTGREHKCLSLDEVGILLVRDDRCPAWIDVSVESHSSEETHVRLLCCGRFVNDPRLMYYTNSGTGPFDIKSPELPFGFVDGRSRRFTLPTTMPCDSRLPNGSDGH